MSSEIWNKHPSGLGLTGEDRSKAVEWVESFLQGDRHESFENLDLELPEAPNGLIRRVQFIEPDNFNEDWIPWGSLSDELYTRLARAFNCRKRIAELAIANNRNLYKEELTSEAILAIYQEEKNRKDYRYPAIADFDLHDVYMVGEAELLRFISRRYYYEDMPQSDINNNENIVLGISKELGVIKQTIEGITV